MNLAGFHDDEQTQAQAPAIGLAPVNAAPPLSPADAKQQAKAAKATKKASEEAERDEAKAKKKAADLAKKAGPVSMAIDMLPGDFRQSLATLWGNLAGHVPSQAEKDAAKNAKKDRKRQNDERKKHDLPALSPPPKTTFEERDLDATVAEQLKKPGSETYDRPNPAIAAFVLDIAKATAAAKIKGSQEFEKMMIISPDAAKPGDFRVRWIGLSGANGGRPPATAPGDVIVHVHYTGLNQPPHKGDFSSALSGRVGYVISGDGSKVWEVRRNGKSIAIDPKNLAGRLRGVDVGRLLPNGKTRYEPFQIKPEWYSPGNQ